MDDPFDPPTLADDLAELRAIYREFFETLTEADWKRPAKRGPKEWNLQQTVAHLCALNGAGLESIRGTLAGQPYKFEGLEDRFHFKDYNLHGIDQHMSLPVTELACEFLGILDGASAIARGLTRKQAAITSEMPIYNRPVKVIEALGIIMFHAGLHHSAQVTEPVGAEPLWKHLSPAIRCRVIGRVMRALSLLYRYDLGGELKATFVFRVDGPGGGCWYVDVRPGATVSGEGAACPPSLIIHLRETAVFCRMFTGRINLPLALLTRQMKLGGDLRLFPRFGALFSVDRTN